MRARAGLFPCKEVTSQLHAWWFEAIENRIGASWIVSKEVIIKPCSNDLQIGRTSCREREEVDEVRGMHQYGICAGAGLISELEEEIQLTSRTRK